MTTRFPVILSSRCRPYTAQNMTPGANRALIVFEYRVNWAGAVDRSLCTNHRTHLHHIGDHAWLEDL